MKEMTTVRRARWERQRQKGLARFLVEDAFVSGVIVVLGYTVFPLVFRHRPVDWTEAALWFGYGIILGLIFGGLNWWRNQRAYSAARQNES